MQLLVPSLGPLLSHFLVPATVAALVAGLAAVPATIPSRPPSVEASRGGATAAGSFSWPLSPRPGVHRRFEQPLTRWSPGHRGVDLTSGVDHPVLSAGDGVVAFSGLVAGRGVVTVRHPGGLRTSYEPLDQRLSSGTRVRRGARIGVLSSTPGHCAPLSCLHWGAIIGDAYRDPLSLLGFGRPILLPLG